MNDEDNPGGKAGYYNWEKDDQGSLFWTDAYLLTDSFHVAAEAIPTVPEPWFVIVATSGAHSPLHNPPPALLS